MRHGRMRSLASSLGAAGNGIRVVVFEPSPADVRAIGVNSLDHTRMGRVATSARTSAFPLINDDVVRLLKTTTPAQ